MAIELTPRPKGIRYTRWFSKLGPRFGGAFSFDSRAKFCGGRLAAI